MLIVLYPTYNNVEKISLHLNTNQQVNQVRLTDFTGMRTNRM